MDTLPQMLKGKAFFIWSKFYRSWTKTSLDMQFSRKSPEVGQKWDQSVGKLIKYLNWNVGSYCTNTGHHRCSWKNIEFWDLNGFASKIWECDLYLNKSVHSEEVLANIWHNMEMEFAGHHELKVWSSCWYPSDWLAILDISKSNSQVSVLGLVFQL